MEEQKKDDRLFIRISPEEKEQLRQIAEREMRPLSNLVRLIIREYIARENQQS